MTGKLNIIKWVKSAFFKTAKFVNLKPKMLVFILVLLLISLLLFTVFGNQKEGLTSSSSVRTQLLSYNTQRNDIKDKMVNFINSKMWNSDGEFLKKLEGYLDVYEKFTIQNYLKTKDLNNDNKVIVNSTSNKFLRDNSGNNSVSSGEKLYYIDLKAEDKNNDNKFVGYRDTDRGNFYRDNSANDPAVFPTISDYIMRVIDNTAVKLTQTDVDMSYNPILAKINTLTNVDEKTSINYLISKYKEITDNIMININNQENMNIYYDQLYEYDPTVIPPSTTATATSEAWKKLYLAELQKKVAININNNYFKELYAQALRTTTNINNENYWKNTYLNLLKETNTNAYANNAYANAYTNNANRYANANTNNAYANTNNAYANTNNAYANTNNAYANTNNAYANSYANNNYDDLYLLKTRIVPPGCPVGTCSANSNILSPTSLTGTGTGTQTQAQQAPGTGAQSAVPGTASVAAGTASVAAGTSTQAGANTSELLGGANAAGTNAVSTQTGRCKPDPIPPCPPCERCPEPAFDCKKVPSYNSASASQYLPQPVLASFSQFGM